jgi:hypothetical protein
MHHRGSQSVFQRGTADASPIDSRDANTRVVLVRVSHAKLRIQGFETVNADALGREQFFVLGEPVVNVLSFLRLELF